MDSAGCGAQQEKYTGPAWYPEEAELSKSDSLG